MTLCITEVKN